MTKSKRGPGRPPKKRGPGRTKKTESTVAAPVPDVTDFKTYVYKKKRGRPKKSPYTKSFQYTGTVKFDPDKISKTISPGLTDTTTVNPEPSLQDIVQVDKDFVLMEGENSLVPIVKIEFVSADSDSSHWLNFSNIEDDSRLRKQITVGFLVYKDKTVTKVAKTVTAMKETGSGAYNFQYIPTVAITKITVLDAVEKKDWL